MTEIQADPRRCGKLITDDEECESLMDAIEQTPGKAFIVYKCRSCGRETVVDSFNLEVK